MPELAGRPRRQIGEPGLLRGLPKRDGQRICFAGIAVPAPGPGEVLIRVRAAGVNPVDVGIVAIPLPFVPDLRLPAVPGWDVAGTVVAVGTPDREESFNPGHDVFGLSRFPRLTH